MGPAPRLMGAKQGTGDHCTVKINVKETATSVLATEKMVPAPALMAAKAVGVALIATQSVG